MNTDVPITNRIIFNRWFPLVLSWSLMALELPLVQSLVSALPEAHHSLAALGLVFAICMMCESPILMLVSAGAALVKDAESFRKLRVFALLLSFSMSILFGIVLLILYYSGALLRICSDDAVLMEKVIDGSLVALIVPLAVGSRRFHQGVLIRTGNSFLLTIGTFTRLFFIVLVGFILSTFTELHGTLVGSGAGSIGVLAESIVITLLSRKAIAGLRSGNQEKTSLSYSGIFTFYTPLAISGIVNLSILPVLTFFMSQGIAPIYSLAGYQVFQGILFFLASFALGMQEVVVSLLGEKQQGYKALKNFTIGLASILGLVFMIYVLTPLSYWLSTDLIGISPDLFLFLHPALVLALPVPVLTVFSVAMRGAVVVSRKTRWVTAASFGELLMVLLVMQILAVVDSGPGLMHAVLALLIARIFSCLLLAKVVVNLRRQVLSLSH